MARYGGGTEDFNRQNEKLQQISARLDQVLGKEAAAQDALQKLGATEERAAEASKVRRQAKKEGADLDQRAAQAARQDAEAINVDTVAVERNARARRLQSQAAKQAAVDISRAQRGARDPLFGRAFGFGTDVSQYRLRQQLGVGQGRAAALQAAVQSGRFTPAGAAERPLGPLTQAQASLVAYEQAEAQLVQATRQLAAVRRNPAATEAQRLEAAEAKNAATAARNAAKLELQSAEQLAAARGEAAAAHAREAAAATAFGGGPGAGVPGRGLIPHPTLYGTRPAAPVEVPRGVSVAQATDAQLLGQNTRAARENNAAHQARMRTIAGEQAAAGNATNAERAYLASLTAEQRQAVVMNRAQAETNLAGQTARTQQFSRVLQSEGAALGSVSLAMHRHGALTQEFILATARGETTLRELGNQALVTAGKFGGWTAAATALFGAAAAIREVGHGAIAAQAGVHTLDRVLNTSTYSSDQAQQAFSDLSRQFNVPLDTAIDAVYRMGQRFHNFPDAVEAAKSSLYSFKTGEVDVTTSTQNLLAVVSGFGLSAQDLTRVYDQINQAQNQFGINIGDTEAGLAKAAGAWRNAGGDLNFLLGLFVAINRQTGRRGQEIGTGLARGTVQLRNTVNQQLLRGQGVDVDPKDIQRTFRNALRRVQQDPGVDVHQIAVGLLGKQYFRLIEPVLRDQNLLNQALKDTSPEKSKGSAQRELGRVLQQVDEQIHQLGFSLQRLGAALARAGAFTFAGILLKGLNLALDLTGRLLELFDKLPQPFRTILTLVAEIGIGMRVLRRFGALDTPLGGALGRTNDEQYALRARKGLRDTRDAAQEEAARTQGRAYTLTNAAQRQQLEVERQGTALKQAQASTATGGVAAQEELNAAAVRYNAAVETQASLARRAAEASQAAADAAAIAAAADEEYIAAKGVSAAALRADMAGRSVPVQTTTPSTRGVVPTPMQQRQGTLVDEQGRPIMAPAQRQTLFATGPALDKAAREAEQAQVPLSGLRQRTQAYTERVRGWGQEVDKTRLSSRLAGFTARGAATATARAAAATTEAMAGLRSYGGKLRGLIGSFGPIEAGVIGLIAGDFLIQQLQSTWDSNQKITDALNQRAGTLKHFEQQQQLARKNLNPPKTGAQSVGESFLGPLGYLPGVSDAIDSLTGRDTRRKIAETTVRLGKEMRAAQAKARAEGRFQPQLLADELDRQVEDDAKKRAEGIISLREFDRRMGLHAKEAKDLFEANATEVQLTAQIIAGAQRQHGGEAAYRTSLKALDIKGLSAEMQAVTSQISDFGLTRSNVRHLQDVYQETASRLVGKNDSASIQALSQARSQVYQALSQTAQADLQTDLAYARTEDQRRAAYSRALSAFHANGLGPARAKQSSIRPQVQAAQKQYQDTLAKYHREEALAGIGDALGIGTPPTTDPKAWRVRVQATLTHLRNLKDKLNQANDDVKYWQRQERAYKAQIRDTSYQDREQGRQIQLAYIQSNTGDTVKQANEAIQSARRQVADAAKTYGVGSREWRQAVTNLRQAENQRDQAIVSTVEADNALLLARAGSDPVKQAYAQVEAAINTLRADESAARPDPNKLKQDRANLITARTNRADTLRQQAQQESELYGQIAEARAQGRGDPVAAARAAQGSARRAMALAHTHIERLQALLSLIQANNQLQDALKQQEDARYDYLESATTDPVKQARIEERKAKHDIRGTHGAARLEARAAYNRAIQARRDAELQSKEQDIDFEQTMGRIDVQTAIDRYQALLHIRHLTHQQKRDLNLKIHQLQQDAQNEASGFDLDIGSLKLPTAFDVRRAFDPIRNQVKHAREVLAGRAQAQIGSAVSERGGVHHHYSVADASRSIVQAQINVYVNDPHAAGRVYDAIDRVMGTHVKSKLRSRHHRRAL